MIRPGYKPRKFLWWFVKDHRDLSFHKTFGTVGYDPNGLPNQYISDAGLTMPNQNADGFPNGCTGYCQTDDCTDEDGVIYDAGEFYLSTPPGGNTAGRQIRDSLNLSVSRGPKTKAGILGPKRLAYYSIQSDKAQGGVLDWFDAIKVALWVSSQEKRSASVGMPWFSQFENEMNELGIMSEDMQFKWASVPGHNPKIGGWTDTGLVHKKPLSGSYLAVKSWQGVGYGDGGWCYMSRTLANNVFNMSGTEAFTVSKIVPNPMTINTTVLQKLVSFFYNLFNS